MCLHGLLCLLFLNNSPMLWFPLSPKTNRFRKVGITEDGRVGRWLMHHLDCGKAWEVIDNWTVINDRYRDLFFMEASFCSNLRYVFYPAPDMSSIQPLIYLFYYSQTLMYVFYSSHTHAD